ncbi:HoxN/HupN/NixA family nickel/cobalt transporter [Streptomyces sp. NPDC059837]|uniref:HoxN/HupN/NixA family nickel/cobalt transporter n=1 Tax=unclassified Streptomyces TaxID=2593676 RepID=UPI0022579826|nr:MULTISPECIES: HoxN/HupN/NixA family nickel/cobalt transporter [unclassified Streptomyces]MCX4409571.1 HoxN/HupN/NixA family nickel/cobalt transporter [Streptomyces sp. NBC_01764]MCX5191343.1 HoxN/HupN/NixA family nickel/cobalt transporter [Streptomyces sp. NBC_00268]
MTTTTIAAGRWTRGERLRLTGIFGVIAALHVIGWTLYLFYASGPAGAGSFAGAGTLAYTLGMRHAFDADHIAAIDDTTRLMMQRGRRPVGVGFFFAMGHSTVVLVIAVIVALAAGAAGTGIDTFRHIGGMISQIVAMLFLLLVAALNVMVLTGIVNLWRRMTEGRLDQRQLELQLLNRGLMNRVLGRRARGLIRSSWHMYPIGFLFGLGLETASEVTLLALSASTAAHSSGLPILAVLSLPLLFAAGMSAFDTVDSMLMTRAYSWAYRSPARRLYYNIATTGMTVAIAAFIASVYTASLIVETTGAGGLLASYASLADHFEMLGYIVATTFAISWLAAVGIWRYRRMSEKYDDRQSVHR